jgi:hypothetical protein
MGSRRAVISRLNFAPAGAGLFLWALVSLAGCDNRSHRLQPLPGNRDDPRAQKAIEIPPGISSNIEKSKIDKKPH